MSKLRMELQVDVYNYLCKIFNAHYNSIPDDIKEDIINDVIETSAFKEGYYSESDIHIAFERVILSHLGIEL